MEGEAGDGGQGHNGRRALRKKNDLSSFLSLPGRGQGLCAVKSDSVLLA